MTRSCIVAYVDYHVLNMLAKSSPENPEESKDWQAIHNIWKYFKEENIRLVTCGDDTEIDIISWLNKQGCCVSDTLMVTEAIEEFEQWGKVDKNIIGQYKKVLEYLEEIEALPMIAGDYSTGKDFTSIADPDKRLLSLLSEEILSPVKKGPDAGSVVDEDYTILRDCLKDLDRWVTEDNWNDLRLIDYQLNWDVLMSALVHYDIEPVFEGKGGERNRNLFGLLNRVIGFSKKSCPTLPMGENHIDFVINTVMRKYNYRKGEREARHIFHCIKHHVGFFLTTDFGLIELFNQRKHVLQGYPEFSSIKLEIIRPSVLEHQVLKGSEG